MSFKEIMDDFLLSIHSVDIVIHKLHQQVIAVLIIINIGIEMFIFILMMERGEFVFEEELKLWNGVDFLTVFLPLNLKEAFQLYINNIM